jgi:ribulose-phosphate 3-epimerase
MVSIVPTVLAANPQEYQTMYARAAALSRRVHVDICDGQFADARTVNLEQLPAAEGLEIDLHLMVQQPEHYIETALSLHPRLVILHAESHGNMLDLITHIHSAGVKAGLALLPETTVDSQVQLIQAVDHVLIFTGQIGHNGGEFQSDQLAKLAAIRQQNSGVEVSVDGGVNAITAPAIVAAGINVLYVGSYLQGAEDPGANFIALTQAVGATA